MFRRLNKSAIW